MKVIKAKADGKWCELVMLPKLPEGEFDIDAVDLSGVELSETHDDGPCVVAENQMQSKFDALAQRTVGEAHASRGNRALEEQAELEEAEQVRVDSNDEDDDASQKGEDSDDDLRFVRASFLGAAGGAGLVSPRGAPAPGSVVPSKRSAPTASSTTKETPKTTPKAKASKGELGAVQTSPAAASPDSSAATAADAAMRKKFEGKTAEEILEKHGLGTIKESMATAEADLLKLGLNKLSIAPSQQYTTDFNEFKRNISNAHKSVVSLDTKVKNGRASRRA